MSDYSRVEIVIKYLEDHANEQPGLQELARHCGLSEFHLQRLFRRWAGVTPKDFLQCLTLSRAKELLAESHSLLETSLELGLSGPSRLHDLFLGLEAMTPGEFKRGGEGLSVRWGVHETPFGDALFAVTARGLCGLRFVEAGRPNDAVTELQARWPGSAFAEDARQTEPFAREVVSRMQGAAARPLPLLMIGSPFQVRVWQALLAIPEGKLSSYADLARLAGAANASRAVGSALAANPIGYLIPCHRVIRSTGAIGDYRWGCIRKRALLGVEGARASAGAA
jgi:AraC family transcriptional regulator, regulatory protein of adaptative response / methylated-DNA-[protein]-cysteine methyltransferase